MKQAAHRKLQILHYPATHHAVEADYHQRCQNTNVRKPVQLVTGSQLAQGTAHVLVRGTPYHKFGHNHRDAHQQHTRHIHQQESAAAMHAGLIGEAPNVAQPHGRTHRGCYSTHAGGKYRSFTFHQSSILAWARHQWLTTPAAARRAPPQRAVCPRAGGASSPDAFLCFPSLSFFILWTKLLIIVHFAPLFLIFFIFHASQSPKLSNFAV